MTTGTSQPSAGPRVVHDLPGETDRFRISIRAAARELLIALAVSMSCAVTIALVVVGVRLWKALNF